MKRFLSIGVAMLVISPAGLADHSAAAGEAEADEFRRVADDDELRYWLENMLWYHGFSTEEVFAATGLSPEAIHTAPERFEIRTANRPMRAPDAPLLVLPYPGGRHPRIGFLDGAVRPQRETKVSVFTPWDESSYVVVDVPEAIFSNLGIIYLAHTHVETVWTRQGIELEKREWRRRGDGSLEVQRTLPNGIRFAAYVQGGRDAVRMELELTNGTEQTLTELRIQNCVMLKGARGFTAQTNENKVFHKPCCAVRSDTEMRWIITAWRPCQRAWGNAACPCLHSDPELADCPPGESRRARGWLSFYEGDQIESELERIAAVDWLHGDPP